MKTVFNEYVQDKVAIHEDMGLFEEDNGEKRGITQLCQ